jgi:hypothetical protein
MTRRLLTAATIAGIALVLSAQPASARSVICAVPEGSGFSLCVDPFPTVDAVLAKVLP